MDHEGRDDEEIWEGICAVAAKQAGIPIAQAKAILANAGFHEFGDAGIVEAVDIVVSHSSRR
jgi:hypothetical protein